jgi:hypothetical protein
MYQKPEIETQVVKPKMTTKFEETDYRFISEEHENNLDNSVKDLENFIAFNHGMGKSEVEKDELYTNAKKLWEVYVGHFRKTVLKFYLNKNQFDYFTEMLEDSFPEPSLPTVKKQKQRNSKLLDSIENSVGGKIHLHDWISCHVMSCHVIYYIRLYVI